MESDVIRKKIWHGSIPISFRLSSDDISDEVSSLPPPFYVLVPRVTYFPLILDKIIRSFRNYLHIPCSVSSTSTSDANSETSAEDSSPVTKDANYWLDFDAIPLKWHYPVGLLFDLYGSPDRLPWEITIHFREYPADILLAPPVSRSAVEAIFLSTLKEADHLKHRGRGGSGPVFSDLLPQDQHQLWTGLLNHRFDLFWPINKRFMQGAPVPSKSLSPPDEGDNEATKTTQIACGDGAALMVATTGMNTFRYCPFRLYFSPRTFKTSLPTVTYLQSLISPFNEGDSTLVTFSDVINTLLRSSTVELHPEDFTFLVHGVEIPPETPAQWMSEEMAYPDNFVHVVACRRNA